MADIDKLQGYWEITSLEVEGSIMPSAQFGGSGILVQGESFKTIAMGAEYGGRFTLDENVSPKLLDLMFVEGPHSGNKSLGIYELNDDEWRICLGFAGFDRPTEYNTSLGSGHALETLRRGTRPRVSKNSIVDEDLKDLNESEASIEGATASYTARDAAGLARFQGVWEMQSCIRFGEALPSMVLKSGKRVVNGNRVKVSVMGQTITDARFSFNEKVTPHTIDYSIVSGPDKDKLQYGIYEFQGDQLEISYASTGIERPGDFSSHAGDGRTVTVWKRVAN